MTGIYTPEDAEQAGWDGPDPLADMTRQRDEAVKAFQCERARVARVQELERKWSEPTFASFLTGTHAAGDLRAALADRPTDDE